MRLPHYQSDLVTVYLDDARDVLPALPKDSVDLLVTDPPYGKDWQSGNRKVSGAFDKIVGDDGSLDVISILGQAVVPLRNCRHVYVFGYSADDLREAMRLGGTADLVWDKGQVGMGNLESPWAPSHERITFGMHVRSAANRARGDGRLAARLRSQSVLRVSRLNSRAVSKHPTEKPVGLMRQLIESSSIIGDTVLDPFVGSGSTLVAAVLSGRKAIGIEVKKDYADMTVERVKAAEALVKMMDAA